jgi:hypothetical protein
MLPYHILTAVNYWSTSASSYFTSYLARAGVIEKMTTDITLNYQKKKKPPKRDREFFVHSLTKYYGVIAILNFFDIMRF